MEDILAALGAQQDELESLLVPLDDAGWNRPSACEGWTIADVVLHVAQSNEMAAGSARGEFDAVLTRLTEGLRPPTDIDDAAALMVDKERGAPPAEVRARWRRSCADLEQALLACSPSDRLHWVAGQLAARTLCTTRLAETWLHTGDVADGLGVTLTPGDQLEHVARLAWRTIPYAFQRAGREAPGDVAFRLDAPSGAAWAFGDDDAPTRITGSGYELCLVAGQRANAAATGLVGEGPRADEVLELVRTFA
jgi:uncharacterized protein (TIGR03084 family)